MPSTSEPTLYEVLGVGVDASAAEIKAAFRKRARKIHPDVAGPEMKSFFLLLQHAHAVLSDPLSRQEYDRTLRAGKGHEEAPQAADAAWSAPAAEARGQVFGEQVPVEAYAGPLPREGHDLGTMPWIEIFDGVDRSSVEIVRGGLRRWQTAVIGAVGGVGALGLALVLPAVYFFVPGVLLAAAGIWWTRRVPARSLVLLGLTAVLVVGGSALMAIVSDGEWIWAVVGSLAALGGFCVLLWAVYELLVIESQRVRWRDIPEGFSWGEPGENLARGQSGFSIDATIDGIEGERLTAAEVGYFLGAIPGVRLVNSLAFPGARGSADVDHAVVCGRRVAFIDSKAWEPAEYALVGGQDAIRVGSGASWDYFPTHMPTAVRRYRGMIRTQGLRGVEVRGYIVVHPKSLAKPMLLSNDLSDDLVQLVTAQELITQLGAWFNENQDQARTVDRRLLSLLLRSR